MLLLLGRILGVVRKEYRKLQRSSVSAWREMLPAFFLFSTTLSQTACGAGGITALLVSVFYVLILRTKTCAFANPMFTLPPVYVVFLL